MANIELGQLVWKVTGDNSGLKKSLTEADRSASGLGSTFKRIGPMIAGALAAAGIGAFAKEVIKAASDAEETAQKFGVVFSSIQKQAGDVARNLAKNYGLSSTASKQLLSDTGDLLTGFGFSQQAALDMSEQVNTLAVDLASFTNYAGGAEGASAALTKGLLGEREALKSLGIAIMDADLKEFIESQGKSYETATRQEKAQATLTLAYKQSKNALGDFARSSDSFANQQRVLNAILEDTKVNIGSQVLPVLRMFQRDLIDAAGEVGEIGKGLGSFVAYTLLAFRIATLQVKAWIREADADVARLVFETVRKMAELANALGLESVSKEIAKSAMGIYATWAVANDEATKLNKKLNESLTAWKNVGKEQEAAKDKTRSVAATTDDAAKKTGDMEKAWEKVRKKIDQVNQTFNMVSQSITGILSGASALTDAIYQKRIDQLDAQMQAELEAAGVAEETSAEQAQREYDAAVATGDALDIEEKRRALVKAQIEEKYRKKKADLEYKAALASWQFQVTSATLQIPLATMNAIASGFQAPWFMLPWFPLAMGTAAAAAAGLNLGAVIASKPQPPKFAEGGIVPGTSFTGDKVPAWLNSGEEVLTSSDPRHRNNISGGQEVYRVVGTRKSMFSELMDAMENGDLLIPKRAVFT